MKRILSVVLALLVLSVWAVAILEAQEQEDVGQTIPRPALILDLAVFNPFTYQWWILNEDGRIYVDWWGRGNDMPVPADYDGDGKTDIAIVQNVLYRNAKRWMIKLSGGGTQEVYWGKHGHLPVPADYDGDGKTDIAVIEVLFIGGPAGRSNYIWYLKYSGGGSKIDWWGGQSHWRIGFPAPADYDGDGKADIAVCNYIDGSADTDMVVWEIKTAKGDKISFVQKQGMPISHWRITPVPADYNADGIADLAVYYEGSLAEGENRQSQWWINYSIAPATWSQESETSYWGTQDDWSVPADYDGDGKTELAVFRRPTGEWFIKTSPPIVKIWRGETDQEIPLPGDYR